LPVSAGLLLAMLRLKEGGREKGGGGGPSSISLFGTTVRDPTPWNAVGGRGRCAVPQPGEEKLPGGRQTDPGPTADAKMRAASTPSKRQAGGQGARSLPPTAPGNKMAGPAEVTPYVPAFQAKPAANQRRHSGLALPLPGSSRSLRAGVSAAAPCAQL
jgi:hypothetical protein